MAYVIRKGRKFYLAESKRTPRGSRQTCTYIGSGPRKCRTLAELKFHLDILRDKAEAQRKVAYARLIQIVELQDEVMARCVQRRDWKAARRRSLAAMSRRNWLTARIDRITRAMATLR